MVSRLKAGKVESMTTVEKPPARWFVYIIRSSDDQLYTGITTDIQRRWREHSTGKAGARYFRGRQPQTLCLLESHENRSSASKREAAIKKLSRSEKTALINGYANTVAAELLAEHLPHLKTS